MTDKGVQRREIPVTKRLMVLVPCIVIMLLWTTWDSYRWGEHYG